MLYPTGKTPKGTGMGKLPDGFDNHGIRRHFRISGNRSSNNGNHLLIFLPHRGIPCQPLGDGSGYAYVVVDGDILARVVY